MNTIMTPSEQQQYSRELHRELFRSDRDNAVLAGKLVFWRIVAAGLGIAIGALLWFWPV